MEDRVVTFNIFKDLYNYHHYPVPDPFHCPKKKSHTDSLSLLISPPSPTAIGSCQSFGLWIFPLRTFHINGVTL